MLVARAHGAGGGFRAQSQVFVAAVGEGVHFFFDDVGLVANGLREQLGFLDDGRADFPVAVSPCHFPQNRFNPLPGACLLR